MWSRAGALACAAWALLAGAAQAGDATSIQVVVPVTPPNLRASDYTPDLQESPCGLAGELCSSGSCMGTSAGARVRDARFRIGDQIVEVLPHSGGLRVHAVDLEIPGRGAPFRFSRTYKSQIAYDGPLGHGWEFGYNSRLVQDPGSNDLLHRSGFAREDRYVESAGVYQSPAGFFTRLVQNPDGSFSLFNPEGTQHVYAAFDGSLDEGALVAIVDRDGNQLSFSYDAAAKLASIRDTLDREITLGYDSDGHITRLTDFAGREVVYAYDGNGDLVSVTSPAVTGTSTGNDYPDGKRTEYGYTSGDPEAALNHNLLTITRPAETQGAFPPGSGAPVLQVVYGSNPGDPLTFDRVTSETYGGLNSIAQSLGLASAGGTLGFGYAVLDPCTNPFDLATACWRATVTDRAGNVAEYDFNVLQNLVRDAQQTNGLRPTEPPAFETLTTCNADSLATQVTRPEGNVDLYSYDSGNPDRAQQLNLLQVQRNPDGTRQGDQTSLVRTFGYEPIFNQLRSSCDPRGTDGGFVPPVDPGVTGCGRYTTTTTFDYEEACDTAAIGARVGRTAGEVQTLLTAAGLCAAPLGDVNGDLVTDQESGNPIRVDAPTVHLLAGSNQAGLEGDALQEVVELSAYNAFGQPVRRVDPEGNVDEFFYHPENDPDGDGQDVDPNPMLSGSTGGHLAEVRRDTTSDPLRDSGTNPPPTNLRTQYFYDRVGNITRRVDGRGVETRFEVNALNQPVLVTRAAGVGVFAPDPPEPLPLLAHAYQTQLYYDFNDNVSLRRVEDRGDNSNVAGFVDTFYRYDLIDDLILRDDEVVVTQLPLRTLFAYDSNQNQTRITLPEGNFHSRTYDERDLPFQATRGAGGPFGGAASTETFHYDRNANLIETVDAEDTDASAGNASAHGGAGDRTRFFYDGYDRLAGWVDAIGNQRVIQYDPAGNRVRVADFGPVGGASPTSDGSPTQPFSIAGTIQAGNLANANLLAASEHVHDELNRRFQLDRALFVNTTVTARTPDVADGAADIGKGDLTPGDSCAVPGVAAPPSGFLGCVTTRFEFDRGSRRTFVVEDDTDTWSSLYDGADRRLEELDPEGNRFEWAYDDANATIEARETDVSQLGGVSDEVFVTTWFYDSLGRRIQSVDNLGQTRYARYDSRDNRIAAADALGPVGPVIVRRAFPPGPQTVDTTNLFGNVATWRYDGLDRPVRTDRVLTASGQGDGVNMGATPDGVLAATPAPDPTRGGGDGLVTSKQEWDGDSRPIRRTDDNGNQIVQVYDNLDRPVARIQGISVSPGLADRDDPDTTESYQYDLDHNVVVLTDQNGSLATSTYDALDRRVQVDFTHAAGVNGTELIHYEYDGLSRPTLGFDDLDDTEPTDSQVVFAWDSLGRRIEETHTFLGSGFPGASVSSAWRAEDLRSTLTYPAPSNRVLDYTYDGLDRLASVQDAAEVTAIASYQYLGRGRVAERAYPQSGLRLTYLDDAGALDVGYDGVRRSVQLRHLRGDDSLVVGFNHGYDRADNKLGEGKLHDASNDESYAYDSAYRVESFTRPSGLTPSQSSFTLDGVGNWAQVDGESREHSSFNEVITRDSGTPQPLAYDENGNLIDDGTYTYVWDPRNRLRAVVQKSGPTLISTYAYDALDRRVAKNVIGAASEDAQVVYVFDSERAIEEHGGGGANPTQQYVYGRGLDELLAIDRNLNLDTTATGAGDARFFVHGNTLDSVFGVTDPSGQIVEGYQYDAYGATTVYEPGVNGVVDFGGDDVVSAGNGCLTFGGCTVNNPYRFTGRRVDVESGLLFFRRRYLDPGLGRFVSRDPIGVWTDAGNAGNGYAYVGNSPAFAGDPMGWGPGDPFNGVDVSLIDKTTGSPAAGPGDPFNGLGGIIDKTTGSPAAGPGDPFNGLGGIIDKTTGSPAAGPGDPFNGLGGIIDKTTGSPVAGPGDPFNGLGGIIDKTTGSPAAGPGDPFNGLGGIIDKTTGSPVDGPGVPGPGDPFNGVDVGIIDKTTGSPLDGPSVPGPGDPFNGVDVSIIDKTTGSPLGVQ